MADRPKALITGASSGVGAAYADLLAEEGYDLVLVARRTDRLDAAAERFGRVGVGTEVVTADLGDLTQVHDLAQRAAQGDIDLLVSNAGVGGYRPLVDIASDEVERLWTLNATTPLLLTRAVLPAQIARRRGGVIAVGAALAYSGGFDTFTFPRSIYASAKASTLALMRRLHDELVDTGVAVTVITPGLIDTEWNDHASADNPVAMSAHDVARAGFVAYSQNEAVCVPALADTALLQTWAAAERALIRGANANQPADRYR